MHTIFITDKFTIHTLKSGSILLSLKILAFIVDIGIIERTWSAGLSVRRGASIPGGRRPPRMPPIFDVEEDLV